jgi:hypothetical protein
MVVRVTMTALFVVADDSVGVTGDEVLVVLGEFDACHSCIVVVQNANQVLTLALGEVEDLDRVVQIASHIQVASVLGVGAFVFLAAELCEDVVQLMVHVLVAQLQIVLLLRAKRLL